VWRARLLDRSAGDRQLLLGTSFCSTWFIAGRKHGDLLEYLEEARAGVTLFDDVTHCYDRTTCFRHGDLFGRRHRYNKAKPGSVVVDIALPAT